MAQAILMGKDGGSGGGKGIKILEASTTNVINFNTLTESGVYLIKSCNGNTVLNGYVTGTTNDIDMLLFVEVAKNIETGAVVTIYQQLFYANMKLMIARMFSSSTNEWTNWDYKTSASYINAGTLAGQVKANATSVQTLGTAQVRNIYAGTTDLTAGTSTLATGDIYLCYE